jgi:hypothetical protein
MAISKDAVIALMNALHDVVMFDKAMPRRRERSFFTPRRGYSFPTAKT